MSSIITLALSLFRVFHLPGRRREEKWNDSGWPIPCQENALNLTELRLLLCYSEHLYECINVELKQLNVTYTHIHISLRSQFLQPLPPLHPPPHTDTSIFQACKAVKLGCALLLSCHHMTRVGLISCTARCPHSVGLTSQAVLLLAMQKLVLIIIIVIIIVDPLKARILQVVAVCCTYQMMYLSMHIHGNWWFLMNSGSPVLA